MRRHAVLGTVASVVALAVVGQRAQAQGFGVYEHDSCTMARGGTGVAAPCGNASAIFFNPAGIVGSANTWDLSFGGTLIAINFHYLDSLSGTTTNTVKNNIPVPAVYLTRQLSPKLAIGIGMYAPYGLVVEWPQDFAGRFLSYRSDLASLYFQPTVAYKVSPKLRIGAGLTYAHTSVNLRQHLELSSQEALPGVTFANLGVAPGTDFANAVLDGSGSSIGGHFGVIFEPTPRISIGARYLTQMTANITGTATFTPIPTGITLAAGNPFGAPAGTPIEQIPFGAGNTLANQSAKTSIPLPDQLIVGVAVKATSALTVLGDYQWVHWSVFANLPLTFANLGTQTLSEEFQNTNGWRLGAEYRMQSLALRGGFLHHDNAAPDQTVTPLLPEGKRNEYTAGLGISLTPKMRIDLAYQYIDQQARRGRVVQPPTPGPSGTAYNTGLYSGNANLFGASIVLGF